MSNVQKESSISKSSVSATSSKKTISNRSNGESCLHEISVCSSVPICRICHCSGEEEQLIQPCHCRGSVRYAHQTCLRTWIASSGVSSCELCNYKFRTKRKCIKNFHKLQFPRPSIKGWLHLSLFLAFFSILVTSLTWILWSQISSSNEAKAERTSSEINYAYALNGGFIAMALIGLYLDSFTHCRSYYRRWALLNQYLVILPYDIEEDSKNKTRALYLPVNSSRTSEPSQARVSISTHQNSVFLDDMASVDKVASNTLQLHSCHLNYELEDNQVSEHLSVMTFPLELPSRRLEQFCLYETRSAPVDLQHCKRLQESYV